MPPFKVLRFLKQLYFSGFSYVFHESFLHRHLHYHASARLLVVRFPLVVCLFCQCLPVCLFVYPIRPPPPLLLPLASPGSGRCGQPLRCARLFASSESARHSGRTFGQASGRRRARALGRSLSGGGLVVVSLLAALPPEGPRRRLQRPRRRASPRGASGTSQGRGRTLRSPSWLRRPGPG